MGGARGKAVGQGSADDFRPGDGGRLMGECSVREASDREGGRAPLLLTVVRSQQHFPKFIPTSAFNPSY